MKILLVEEQVADIDIITRMLPMFGHAVVVVSTLKEAWTTCISHSFDAVIFGIKPEDDLAALSELAEQCRAPAIVLSASTTARDIAKSEEAGFKAHLLKPVDIAELARRLAKLEKPSS